MRFEDFAGLLIFITFAVFVGIIVTPSKEPPPATQTRSVEQYCNSATLPKVCQEYLEGYFNGVYAP